MKNIQVIDGAQNCSYDVYAISEKNYSLVFPNGQDVEFIDDFVSRVGRKTADDVLKKVWKKPISKEKLQGLHGTIFFELNYKKAFYPTKKQSEMVTGFEDSSVKKKNGCL